MNAVVSKPYATNEVPQGRMGNVNDIAGVTLFLVGKGGAYVNGTSQLTDGSLLEYSSGAGTEEYQRPNKRPHIEKDGNSSPVKNSKKNNPGRPRKGYSNDEEEESEVDV